MPMATTMAPATIEPSVLNEIKAGSRHLHNVRVALRALIENRYVLFNHQPRLAALLDELRDQLAWHFTLEEAFGHLDDATASAPHLSQLAEQLRGEHNDLFEALADIADEAQAVCVSQRTPAGRLRSVVHRLREFDEALTEHEDNESRIVFEALQCDIGGEG